jgi:predicted permease
MPTDPNSLPEEAVTAPEASARSLTRLPWYEEFGRDLGFALRQLRKNPGFTATALITLALCLGANLSIFAVVDAILVRPLPFPEQDRLVTIFNAYPKANVERGSTSLSNYYDRRGSIKAFASLAIYQGGSVVVGQAGSPQRVPIGRVSPEFFATLGVPLAMGKMFTDSEMAYGPDEVAVITDGFWRSYFNADPNVLGRKFFNDGLAITVIGVLPRDFRYLSSRAQFFRPAAGAPEDRGPRNRHNNNWETVARLAPNATLAEAQAQIDAFNAQQLTDDPYAELIKNAGYRTTVRPLHADHVRSVKPMLVLLQSGVLFLLLIGTVNLANLLLIRASGRAKEFAVRQALGAGRMRIARGLLVETMLLALVGGILGLAVGAIGIRLFGALGTERLPLAATIAFDGRVAAISLAGAVVVGALLAVPVIWLNLHAELAPGLQIETRGGTTSRAAQSLRYALIVAQVSVAFVLLSGAGLLALSLKRVLETPPGFNSAGVLTGQLTLPWKNYRDDAARLAFVERLVPALRALPGVTHVALSSGLPFADGSGNNAVIVEGWEPKPGDSVRAHFTGMATTEYWSAMGIPLVEGRLFEDADNHRKPNVCVVDQAFADRYWPKQDPLGHRLASGGVFNEERAATVVGVVASVKQKELSEKPGYGAVYFPYASYNSISFSLVVRTSLPPASLASAVQKTILQLDPELPVDGLKPMQTLIDESLVERRSPAILAAVFAGAALFLSSIGTYGVLAYGVGQRRREIGVRMALGARPAQIGRQFLALGVRLLVAGIILGTIGALFTARGMQSLLFEVPPLPWGTLAVTAGIMGVVSLTASFLPARRAARVDPMVALRAD